MRCDFGSEDVCPCTTREPSHYDKDTWRRLTLGLLAQGRLLLGVGKILGYSKNPVLKSAIIYSKTAFLSSTFFAVELLVHPGLVAHGRPVTESSPRRDTLNNSRSCRGTRSSEMISSAVRNAQQAVTLDRAAPPQRYVAGFFGDDRR